MNKLFTRLKTMNDAFAVGLSKAYGTPLAIWFCILFSLCGAFVAADVLNKMTFWSNAIQLVFCPLSIYVSSITLKHTHDQKKKIELIHKHLGIKEDK